MSEPDKYPYRRKLTCTLGHARCEQWIYEWFVRMAEQQKLPICEIQRVAYDHLARSGWPYE